MKRGLSLIITLLCIEMVCAQRAVIVDGMMYQINSVTVGNEVTQYAKLHSTKIPKEEIETLSIPDSVELDGISYPVTTIGSEVFSGCSSLTKVEFGSALIRIEKEAFFGCSSLSSLTLPSNLAYIGEKTFSACGNLSSIVIENANSTISFGNEPFTGTTMKEIYIGRPTSGLSFAGSEVESIVYGSGITSLPQRACAEITTLKEVTLPSSLTEIGKECFLDCSQLSELNLPDGVTNIGASAFKGCTSLKITLPQTIKRLGDYALSGTLISSARIPQTLTSLGNYVFAECQNLTEASLPSSLTAIPEGLFYECVNLKELSMPDHINGIGEYAFYGCLSLGKFTIPAGVTKLTRYVFCGSKFTTLTIPSTVETIGMNALWCTIDELIIEASDKPLCFEYTWYGYQPFPPSHNNPDGNYTRYNVTTIGKLHLNRAIYGKTSYPNIILVETTPFRNSTITSVTFGSEISALNEYSFSGCTKLKRVHIPSNLTLSNGIFSESGLSEVTFDDEVRSIPEKAFNGCRDLRNITLPIALANIGDNAFENVELDYISCLSTTPPTGNEEAFTSYIYDNTILYVPSDLIYLYQTSWPWINFSHILPMESMVEGIHTDEDVHIDITDGTIKVEGTDRPIEVYTTDGRKVTVAESGTVTGLPAGLYIVRCGSAVSKICLR